MPIKDGKFSLLKFSAPSSKEGIKGWYLWHGDFRPKRLVRRLALMKFVPLFHRGLWTDDLLQERHLLLKCLFSLFYFCSSDNVTPDLRIHPLYQPTEGFWEMDIFALRTSG